MAGTGHPYGLLARFADEAALLHAVRAVRRAGYRHIEAYAPLPSEALAEALDERGRAVPAIALAAGLLGAAAAFALQAYSAIDYPFVVGGKPIVAWPPFMVVTFSVGVLSAVLSAALAMLLLNGYPRPYHPVFNVPGFARHSSDGYFLCIEASDPRFSLDRTGVLMRGLGAIVLDEVPP